MQKQVRVVAIHDTAGTISMLVASPADGERAGVKLEPWEYMHEVEVPDLVLDAEHAQIHARLDEIIENFRVEVETQLAEGAVARLVRKSNTQAY
jgi:hypothetical protein